MHLTYSDAARSDLVRLRGFIAEHNPEAASRISKQLIQRVERLCDFPNMGKQVSRAPEALNIRDMVFDAYVVRYLHHGDAIVILRIWHHAEDRDWNDLSNA